MYLLNLGKDVNKCLRASCLFSQYLCSKNNKILPRASPEALTCDQVIHSSTLLIYRLAARVPAFTTITAKGTRFRLPARQPRQTICNIIWRIRLLSTIILAPIPAAFAFISDASAATLKPHTRFRLSYLQISSLPCPHPLISDPGGRRWSDLTPWNLCLQKPSNRSTRI